MENIDYLTNLKVLKGVGPALEMKLKSEGFLNICDIAKVSGDEFSDITSKGTELVKDAREYVNLNYNGVFIREVTGLGEELVSGLCKKGCLFPEDILSLSNEDLSDILGSNTHASKLKNCVRDYMEEGKKIVESWVAHAELPIDVAWAIYNFGTTYEAEISEDMLLELGIEEDKVSPLLERLELIRFDREHSKLEEEPHISSIEWDSGAQTYDLVAGEAASKIIELNDRYDSGKITNLDEINRYIKSICNPFIEFHGTGGSNSHIIAYLKKCSNEKVYDGEFTVQKFLSRSGVIFDESKGVLDPEDWPQSARDLVSIGNCYKHCNDARVPDELNILVALQPYAQETEFITGVISNICGNITDEDLPESADCREVISLDGKLAIAECFVRAGASASEAIKYTRKVSSFASNPEELSEVNPMINVEGIPEQILSKAVNYLNNLEK